MNAFSKRRRADDLDRVPTWIFAGAIVNYHSIIRGPVTHPKVTVTSAPFLLGGHTACVMLQGISGAIACAALTRWTQ